MTARHRLAIAVAAVVLVAPPTASAQSPGDEQYTDPFGGSTPSQPERQDEGGGQPAEPEPADEDAAGGGSAQPEPAPAPEPAPEPAPVTSTQTAQPPSAESQLPRTGAPAGLIAAGGALLLVGGVVLRVRFSERGLRRRTSWRADRA